MATEARVLPNKPWFRKLISLLRIQKKQVPLPRKSFYDLQEIFNEVNATYFSSSLNLPIQWSGSGKTNAKTMVRLGSYHLKTQKIRINRLLDAPHIPRFVLSYVIYHEALHHLFPPLQTPGSRRQIHHPLFQQKEREFQQYEEVQAFLKTFKKRLFFSKEPFL